MNAAEFRPINSMPADEKFIEIIVKNQLVDYVERNKIISKNQSAFRKGHSWETIINYYVCNKINKAIENAEIIVIVFLDLKRAFETVDIKMV